MSLRDTVFGGRWFRPGFEEKVETEPNPEEAQRLFLAVMPFKGMHLKDIETYDPDKLIRRKDLTVIDDMLRDDAVKAAMTLKQNASVSGGWHIQEAEDNPNSEIHKEFIEDNLAKMDGSVEKVLMNITSALPYGFSVQEVVLKPDNGHFIIDKLVSHAPHNLDWIVDPETQSIVGIEQISGSIEPLPVWKALVYRWNSKFENPWGQTDLDAAYRPWFSKDVMIRYWNMHGERVALQRLIATYESSLEGVANEMIDEWVESIGMAIPEGVSIEFTGGGSDAQASSDVFAKAIEVHDQAIARSILKQTLATGEGTRVGSMALGRVHQDTFAMELNTVQMDISETVMTEQLIRLLIDLNFGPQSEYPRFVLADPFPEDPDEFAERYVGLIKEGGITPTKEDEDRVRQLAELPPREGEDPPPGRAAKGGGFGASPFEREEYRKARPLTETEQTIDFQMLETAFDSSETVAVKGLEEVVGKVEEKLLADVARKFFKGGVANAREVNKFKIPFLGEFRRVLRATGLAAFEMGRKDFRKHFRQTAARRRQASKFDAANPGGQSFQQQIRAFENRWAARSEAVATEFGREVERDVRNVLLKALETGETQRETEAKLAKVFEKYTTGTTTAGGAVNPWRLETMVRTNFNGAYNQGRFISSRDPDVADFVQGYVYSAILDQRTSDICDGLDGIVLAANDPQVDRIVPPNHFNCRSILVEVFTGEAFDQSTSRQVNTGMQTIQEGFS